jgi:putative hemolysin
MRKGNARARALHGYLDKPEDFVWTILVGNTLVNLAIVSVGVLWLYEAWPGRPGWILAALSGGVLVFYAVCELFPKMLFRTYPNRLCLMLAPAFGLLHAGLRPLVALMAWLARGLLRWTGGRRFTGHLFGNREELRQVMQESSASLTTEERRMISRVLDLQNLTVGQVLTPMSMAASIAAQAPISEAIAVARERGFNRLPVWRADGPGRRVVGLLNVGALLFLEHLDTTRAAGDFVQPAVYLDADLRLERALGQLQGTGQRLAVVLGPDRTEIGLVSLQDILKVVFGEVRL